MASTECVSQVSWGSWPIWALVYFIVRAHTMKELMCIKCLRHARWSQMCSTCTSHQICMTALQGHCLPSNRWESSSAGRLGICARSCENERQRRDSHPHQAKALVPRRPTALPGPW